MDLQTPRRSPSLETNRAIQDLIESCRGQLPPDGTNCQSHSSRCIDLQHACDELLDLTFDSEDGRLQVIDKLTTLDGNFVVKIIRKGLVSLSKVYSDSRTFQEESLNLVDLCCSQLQCLQKGCQNERLVASPASIVNWTLELCDELMSNETLSATPLVASLSNSASKIKDLYESIRRSSEVIQLEELKFPPPYLKVLAREIFTFEGIINILKPRIHDSEGFEDVVEQTAAIVKTDVKNKPYICVTLLSRWINLLKVNSVTTWFAAQVAKHDSFLHCATTKEGSNVPENSLICQVSDAIESLISSGHKYECCDKERMTILFSFPGVFLLRPKACIRLIESREVCIKVIEDIFLILADTLTKDAIKDTDPYHFKSFTYEVRDRARKMLIDDDMETYPEQKYHQKISLNAITQALLTFPDKQQALKIVEIWKFNFPDDTSHHVLSALFVLVIEVIEIKKENMIIDMEQLVIFLPVLCSAHKDTLSLWLTLLPSLMEALPCSWYHPENLNLIETHVNKIKQISNSWYHSLFCVDSFLVLLKRVSLPETVKTKVFHLGMDLLGEMNYVNGCSEFSFYLILSLLSIMDVDRVRQYSLELLKVMKESGCGIHNFNPIINIIIAVRKSSVIEMKKDILDDLLLCLNSTRKDNTSAMLFACSEFLKFSINTENTKRFFDLAATGPHYSRRLILHCLCFNNGILKDCESINNHVNFLFQIVNEKLTLNAGHLEQLTNVVCSSQSHYCPTVDIFETMVTAVARDIAVSTFDMDLNKAALRVTTAAAATHPQDPPIDFHLFYVELNQTFRKSKHFERTSLSYAVVDGLWLIARLPLTLKQIGCLIQRIMAIPHEQDVRKVLFKFFRMHSNGLLSLLDQNDLCLTFERLLASPTIGSAHETPLKGSFDMDSYTLISIEQTLTSLKLPKELFHDMAQEKETAQNSKSSSLISQVTETYADEVLETELHEKAEDIKQMLLRVPQGLSPLIGKCLRKCYKVGFSDHPSIETLTEEVMKNAENWKTIEKQIKSLARLLSDLSPDKKLGSLLGKHIRQCYLLGLREKPSPQTAILSILRGFPQWKNLKSEIMEIVKEVSSVSPALVSYLSSCVEECDATVDVDVEPTLKSLTLQILKTFEFYERLAVEIEKMEQELSNDVPEFVPSISEYMRQCYIAGLGEIPQTKQAILQIFECVDAWKELESKILENGETTSSLSELISLVITCMKHSQVFSLSEDGKRVEKFILQVIEAIQLFTWNHDDIGKMNKSCLKIPRQLCLIYKEAKSSEEAKEGLVKAFDVIRKLDPSIHAKNDANWVCQLLQLDFYLLLKEYSATTTDVYYALLVCEGLELSCLSDFISNFFRSASDYDIFESDELLKMDRFRPLRFFQISDTKEEIKSEFPSPGYVAYLVIKQMRRLGVPDGDLQEKTQKLLSHVFHDHPRVPCVSGIRESMTYDDKLKFLFKLMNEASYLAEFEYWLSNPLPHHHITQCGNVITTTLSWKKGRKSCEEAMRLNEEVYETLLHLQEMYNKRYSVLYVVYSCNAWMSEHVEIMTSILKTTEQEDVALKLFRLLRQSTTATEACLDIIPSWNTQETLSLVEKLSDLLEKKSKEMDQRALDNDLRVVLKILPFAARKFPNSAAKTISFLEDIVERNCGHEDKMGLVRLPVWYERMTSAGYDQQAIRSWCTSLVHKQDLCSRDVDTIANMTPETIKLLNKESDEVGKCLFPANATEDTKSFKRRLSFARLLNELAWIAIQLKDDSNAGQKITEAVTSLCSRFTRDPYAVGDFYKERDELLKELFVALFGGENGEHTEPLKKLANEEPLSMSFIVLIRRLARCFVLMPITVKYAMKIVHAISNHVDKIPDWQYLDVQAVVHLEVLHFESNQDAIQTLQAAGYNQSTSANEDLWYSTSIQMSAYVPTVKSFESSRKENLLRQLWREWKPVLSGCISVEVDGKLIEISELFKPMDSLEMLESQFEAVKQQADIRQPNKIQLLRNEKRLRQIIKEQAKQIKKTPGNRLAKMVIVWENSFLECVKMCSEKIPDCYAPNGFHSEKPVICGIAVDNRILALYKEDERGTRTEVENVEVKLYPAGLVVFGEFRDVHPHDTEQLWAAFYKMLLDKHLVPKIFITNVSPAFDWIKQSIAPETTAPDGANVFSCCDLIPISENSFDYNPEVEIPNLHRTVNPEVQELIILTPEKTKLLETQKIKPPNRDKMIRENIDKVVLHLQDDGQLQTMHPKSHDKILDRLKFAIRQAVEVAVDGGEPTQESTSRSIDMRRLLFGCQDAQHQYSKEDYSAVILDAVNTVTRDLQGSRQSYDGCQHVVFLQPNEN